MTLAVDLPREVKVLLPATCECVTFHGKWDSPDVIKLRILSWKIFLDYPNGSSVNIRVLFRRKKEGSNQNLKKRCDDRNRGRERQGHEQSNETASGRWKVHRFRPRAFGKNAALPTDFRTSDTENYKIKCVVLNL